MRFSFLKSVMENVIKANGSLITMQPMLVQDGETRKITVQQALSKWYSLLSAGKTMSKQETLIFPNMVNTATYEYLKTDLVLIPGLLMDEMINNAISDKQQYIRIVQALLVNLSDLLYPDEEIADQLFTETEAILQFIQSFFYKFFDFEYRVSSFSLKQFRDLFNLKIEYWKIKLQQSTLLNAISECMNDKMMSPENYLSFRKLNYIKNLFREIESATAIITDDFIRDLFIYRNFNSGCFVDYEIGLIRKKISDKQPEEQIFTILRDEQLRIAGLNMKHGASFDLNEPSVKKQLSDWTMEEIKRQELNSRKKAGTDIRLEPEEKIQTSLSVAKLAALLRLLVADKIIINKTVAPMLRTISKLFTTLQKDEISFGSLETKYHAPDKATLNMMKEILQKWVVLTGKL